MSSTDQPGPGTPDSSDAGQTAPGQLTNEQRRADAKRKLETRLDSQQRAARRRRRIIIGTSTVVAVAVVVAGVTVGTIKFLDARENARYTACEYTSSPSLAAAFDAQSTVPPGISPQQLPAAQQYAAQYRDGKAKLRTAQKPDERELKSGDVSAEFATSQGSIPMTLDRSSAPCNVATVISLIRQKYYDNTPCHRMTEGGDGKIAVLQCGDPTGTGSGQPGFNSPDEFPTDLKAVPQDPQQAALGIPQYAVYPRGTIAVANGYQPSQAGQPGQGENTGGAQLFLVIQDSQLPPNYSVVGTVDEPGLAVLDKVFKGGVAPVSQPSRDPNTGAVTFAPVPGDGAPKLPVTIERATVS